MVNATMLLRKIFIFNFFGNCFQKIFYAHSAKIMSA